VLNRGGARAIAAVCREHDLLAVTDEVYEHLVYDGEHVPLATLPGDGRAHAHHLLGGKTFSFTGWKVGWACGPAELVSAARTAKQFLTYTVATPLQHAVAAALALGDDYYAGLAAGLHAKRDRLCAGLEAAGLEVFRPAGTYFVNADVARTASRSAEPARARPAWWPCRPPCSTPTRRGGARSCASRSASATR
jgi:N-succinyldiaminopimelate aminotransferase